MLIKRWLQNQNLTPVSGFKGHGFIYILFLFHTPPSKKVLYNAKEQKNEPGYINTVNIHAFNKLCKATDRIAKR